MHEEPLITIGITSFNSEETIIRAIESALHQTWINKEIILVDDGSIDDSCEIINREISGHLNCRLIEHEHNKGFPSALNTLIKESSGKFIAFFDDDDFSDPERLTKQFQRINEYELKQSTQFILCYSRRVVDKNGKVSLATAAIGQEKIEPFGPMVADFLLLHIEKYGYSWGQFGSCTMMARVETLKKMDCFDPAFRRSAEWDLAIRASLDGCHFIAEAEPLITQYITDTEDKAGKVPLQYALLLRRKHREYLKGQGVYLASIAIAYARFYYAKNKTWRSRLAMGAACFLSPTIILKNMLMRKFK